MQRKLLFLAVTVFIAVPLLFVFAQPPSPTPVPDVGVPKTALGLYQGFCTASNWFFAFVILLAVLSLLYGAMKFFTAGGSDDTTAAARKFVTLSVVGIVVAMLARSLVYVTGNFVGATQTTFFGC